MTTQLPNIYKALEFLEKCQNKDGGICGLSIGSASAAAPTAHVLQVWTQIKDRFNEYKFDDNRYTDAINYLLKNGPPWRDMNGFPNVHSTSKCIITLIDCGLDPQNEKIKGGIRFLLNQRNQDYGWGYSKGHESLPYFTYYALHALSKTDKEQYQTYIEQAIKYIEKDLKIGKWNQSPVNIALGTLALLEKNPHKYMELIDKNLKILNRAIGEDWREDSYTTQKEPYFTLKFFTPKILLLWLMRASE